MQERDISTNIQLIAFFPGDVRIGQGTLILIIYIGIAGAYLVILIIVVGRISL